MAELHEPECLSLDPSRKRQFGKDGLIVVWRDKDGVREGIAAQAKGCSNPQCPCTAVDLVGLTLQEEPVALRAVAGGIELRSANGEAGDEMTGESFSVMIITTTGEVSAEGGAASDDMVDWWRQEADGELLDVLSAWLERHKGYDPDGLSPFDEEDTWEPGDMLCYGTVFPRCREDRYPLGSRIYSMIDLYCPDPSCDCGEVILTFREDDEISDEDIGAVILTLSGSSSATEEAAVEFSVDGIGPLELLEQLYDLFRARYPDVSFHRERQDRLKANAQYLRKTPQRRISTKVARNAPCPCGSGKKYKKCCLQH